MKHLETIRRTLIPAGVATEPIRVEATHSGISTESQRKKAAPQRPLEYGRPKWPGGQ